MRNMTHIQTLTLRMDTQQQGTQRHTEERTRKHCSLSHNRRAHHSTQKKGTKTRQRAYQDSHTRGTQSHHALGHTSTVHHDTKKQTHKQQRCIMTLTWIPNHITYKLTDTLKNAYHDTQRKQHTHTAHRHKIAVQSMPYTCTNTGDGTMTHHTRTRCYVQNDTGNHTASTRTLQ